MIAFRRISGHQRLTSLLASAIVRGTFPPTLLFAGPTGVGKFAVARATAAALNCLNPRSAEGAFAIDACGTCRACDRIARNVHVDVFVLEPDERASIKIDVVREVLDRTGFRPFEGRRRVVIIRDAETLEPQAQNALLKALEEPPPATIFILTTAVPGALLPTVRSRCMRLAFGRLTEADVAAVLTRDFDFSARDAGGAAALADGSVGHALELGTTDIAVMREIALQLLQQLARSPAVASRLQAAGALYTGTNRKDRPREELGLILRMIASMLRDIELLNAGGAEPTLANGGFARELGAIARAFAGERARQAFAAVDKAHAAVSRNAGTKVVAEWVAVQI